MTGPFAGRVAACHEEVPPSSLTPGQMDDVGEICRYV